MSIYPDKPTTTITVQYPIKNQSKQCIGMITNIRTIETKQETWKLEYGNQQEILVGNYAFIDCIALLHTMQS